MATTINQTNTKSLHLHQFIRFIIIIIFLAFLLLISPTSSISHHLHESSPKNSMSPSKRFLLQPSTPSSSTMSLRPTAHSQRSRTSSTSTRKRRREFGAEAHEVPSGPNPISN
ncbi:PREDICTED: CLAVATA3/ESR (CLE)-related protein 44-like [Camelina sativa]|uniref:CLAVATA3/ESR (CLE)-related protein 44-like n=1 Tax=Camelina sativa TaxID=90675 RepID=A0ABM0U3L9_CAMSA|nr:PREDICTED: CLAVATA3/ESR (CLE)-related protein 44-like [Camelina sativa]